MRLIPYNLLIETGECISKTSSNYASFIKCKNSKKLEIDKQHNIKHMSSKKYLADTSSIRSSGIYFNSFVKTNHFERIYDTPEWQLVYKQGKEELANSSELFLLFAIRFEIFLFAFSSLI